MQKVSMSTRTQFQQGRTNAPALIALAVMTWAGLCAAAPTEPASAAASAPMPFGHASALALRKKAAPPAPVRLVDINSASRKELKTLPGIGDAEADKIIANRPYLSKTELVTKQVLPTGPYLSLRKLVVAMQKIKPKSKG
jgi:competence protein ComEA